MKRGWEESGYRREDLIVVRWWFRDLGTWTFEFVRLFLSDGGYVPVLSWHSLRAESKLCL